MRRRARGMLMMEAIVAVVILSTVALALVTALARAGEHAAEAMHTTAAAARLDEVLADVRAGALAIREGDLALPARDDAARLPEETVEVRTRAWPTDARLVEVTVTVRWRERLGRERSASATTLVRKSRLRIEGGS